MVEKYLPDIIKAVAEKVDEYFSSRAVDPFHVYFNHGNYSQVTRDLYDKETGAAIEGTFPLIWLVAGYDQHRGVKLDMYSQASGLQIIIAMPTNNEYTQLERDEYIFKPRLLPIYDQFLEQASQNIDLANPAKAKIEHTLKYWYYWGGGDVPTADTQNLFRDYIDALQLLNLNISVKSGRNH